MSTDNTARTVVYVTQDDIDNGGWDASSCPIAQAMHRAGYWEAAVGLVSVTFLAVSDGESRNIRLTSGVRRWIRDYDNSRGWRGEPFDLVIEPERRKDSPYSLRGRYVRSRKGN